LFQLSAHQLFAKPESPILEGEMERWLVKMTEVWRVMAVKEPARLGQFRKHLIKVTELNRETWRYVRAETDNDHVWLPNPKQKSVLGLPVSDARIDAWLAMVAELEALLEGRRTFTILKNGKGLNLKTLLEHPPEKFVLDSSFPETLPDKYFSERRDVDMSVLFRVFRIFEDPTSVAYAVWFN
jgi:hypothetical protein